MPESVKDRPTKSHEYMFLLTKSEKYYYDAEAIAEPLTESSIERGKYGWNGKTGDSLEMGATPSGGGFKSLKKSGNPMSELYNPNGRNRRSVWTINTQPTSYAHFATFPEKLVEPCILAGSKPGDVVFDPFAGSGTTGRVAIRYGREFIGCELNFKYIHEISHKRLTVQPMMLGVQP